MVENGCQQFVNDVITGEGIFSIDGDSATRFSNPVSTAVVLMSFDRVEKTQMQFDSIMIFIIDTVIHDILRIHQLVLSVARL